MVGFKGLGAHAIIASVKEHFLKIAGKCRGSGKLQGCGCETRELYRSSLDSVTGLLEFSLTGHYSDLGYAPANLVRFTPYWPSTVLNLCTCRLNSIYSGVFHDLSRFKTYTR